MSNKQTTNARGLKMTIEDALKFLKTYCDCGIVQSAFDVQYIYTLRNGIELEIHKMRDTWYLREFTERTTTTILQKSSLESCVFEVCKLFGLTHSVHGSNISLEFVCSKDVTIVSSEWLIDVVYSKEVSRTIQETDESSKAILIDYLSECSEMVASLVYATV